MDGGTMRAVVVLISVVGGCWLAFELASDRPPSPEVFVIALVALPVSWWLFIRSWRNIGLASSQSASAPIMDRLDELVESFARLVGTDPDRAAAILDEYDEVVGSLPAGEQMRPAAIGRVCRAELCAAEGRHEEVDPALGPVERFTGPDSHWWVVELRARELRAFAAWMHGRLVEAESESLAAAEIDRRITVVDLDREPRWPDNLLVAASAAAYLGAHGRAAAHLDQAASVVGTLGGTALESAVLETRLLLAHRARRLDEVRSLLGPVRRLVEESDEADSQLAGSLHEAERSVQLPGATTVPPPVPCTESMPVGVSREWLAGRVERAWELDDQLRFADEAAVLGEVEPHVEAFENDDRYVLLFQMAGVRTRLGDGVGARRAIDALDTVADEFPAHVGCRMRSSVHLLLAGVLTMEQSTDAALAELDRAAEVAPLGAWDKFLWRQIAGVRSFLAVRSGRWDEVEAIVAELADPDTLDDQAVRGWATVMLHGATAAAASGRRDLAQDRMDRASEALEQCGGPASLAGLLIGRLRVLSRLGPPGQAWALVGPLVAALDATGDVAARADIDPEIEALASQLGLDGSGGDE